MQQRVTGTAASEARPRYRRRAHLVGLGALAALLALPLAAHATGYRSDDPLLAVRQWHRLQLALRGADVRPLPAGELQQAHNDCALAIVARLYRGGGRAAPPIELLQPLFDLGPRGVTLDRLAQGMQQLGWSTAVSRGSRALKPPSIALLRPGHYVLLTRRSASHMEYFDPLIGQVRQPLPQFEARWTGKGVQLSTRDN